MISIYLLGIAVTIRIRTIIASCSAGAGASLCNDATESSSNSRPGSARSSSVILVELTRRA